MNEIIYVSDTLELAETTNINDHMPKMMDMAVKFEMTLTIMEEENKQLIMFTYNSPKMLEFGEMKYLDERFDVAVKELREFMKAKGYKMLN